MKHVRTCDGTDTAENIDVLCHVMRVFSSLERGQDWAHYWHHVRKDSSAYTETSREEWGGRVSVILPHTPLSTCSWHWDIGLMRDRREEGHVSKYQDQEESSHPSWSSHRCTPINWDQLNILIYILTNWYRRWMLCQNIWKVRFILIVNTTLSEHLIASMDSRNIYKWSTLITRQQKEKMYW